MGNGGDDVLCLERRIPVSTLEMGLNLAVYPRGTFFARAGAHYYYYR